jgi:hypothetical protein
VSLRRAVRAAAAVVAAALTIPLAAPWAGAAPADWAGSAITSSSATTEPDPQITATFLRAYDPTTSRVVATTRVTAPEGLPAGCASSLGTSGDHGPLAREGDKTHRTTASLTTTCNGEYAVTVTATRQARSCGILGCSPWASTSDVHTLSGTLAVRAPAPPVAGATATQGSGRSVVIGWTPAVDAPPDFLGYRVERVSASGDTVTIATIDDRTASSVVDDEPPAEGGTTTYHVYGRRAAPGGEVGSAATSTSTEVTPLPGGGGGDGDGDDGGSDGDPDGGSPGGGPGVTSPGGRSPSISGGPGSVRAPRVGSPSRRLFPPLASPAVDAGFEETLPFEAEPGDADPVLPDDELASSGFTDVAGRGLVIPVATALLMAVWAFHLRYLARAARPDPVDHG